MSSMPNYSIRTATPQEFAQAVEWAAQEGWNPGLKDNEVFNSVDPDGFLMGFLDEQPVASISAVRWGKDFAFIGLYIVKSGYRGRGFGFRLWKAAMERLEGMCVGLDGVVAQQDNYAKSGFVLAHRGLRFAGKASQLQGDSGEANTSHPVWPALVELDGACSPASRTAYLRAWVDYPGGLQATLQSQGEVRGWGLARPCRHGYKIAPLLAADEATARQILAGLTQQLEADTPVFLDVPEPNRGALHLCEELGLEVQFEVARMYTRDCPHPPDLNRLFGVMSYELG